MTNSLAIDTSLAPLRASLVAVQERAGNEYLIVDLATENWLITKCRDQLAATIGANITLLADAKANLTKWQISPSPDLRVICLTTIKKLIAKQHNETLSLPEFSLPKDAVTWWKTAATKAFLRINKLEISTLVDVECRVIPAVMAMENRGLPFDKMRWQNALTNIEQETKKIKHKLDEILPNDNGFLLFGQKPIDLHNAKALKISLEKILGTKLAGTSYSSLKDFDHEAVKLVISYRELSRMLSNYGEAFLPKIVNDRIKGHFTIIGSASGRFACHDTNLLALPNDKVFQACITPRAPYVLRHFDYGAFELRILAAQSGDETLIRIFNCEQDIHSMVAQEIFNLTVTKTENAHLRDQAKTLNFGLIYGMGETALARQLKISKSKAHDLLRSYFKRFHRVHEYLSSLEKMAKKDGYVKTLLGRRAYFTDNNDEGLITRFARNFPIQGTGADIVKLALCRVYRELKKAKLDAHVINLVHDEFVIEVHENHCLDAEKIVQEEMAAAFTSLCGAVPAAISVIHG